MIVAFVILGLFALFVWYVIEDLLRVIAHEVGVDGPSLLRLATFEHEPTDTVDADTTVGTL